MESRRDRRGLGIDRKLVSTVRIKTCVKHCLTLVQSPKLRCTIAELWMLAHRAVLVDNSFFGVTQRLGIPTVKPPHKFRLLDCQARRDGARGRCQVCQRCCTSCRMPHYGMDKSQKRARNRYKIRNQRAISATSISTVSFNG
jgi:hypothetical protein